MTRLSFSGHESFFCKQFWLKKGYDYTTKGKLFSDANAVVELGVGKNMVSSIRFWLRAFNIIKETDESTGFSNIIFGENGYDNYLEDYGSLCLLHYNLVKKGRASIYNLVFNEFRKERIEFTKDHLHSFIKKQCDNTNSKYYNVNTVKKDINVFFRNYLPISGLKSNIEEDFSALLLDLNLIESFKSDGIDWYKIEGKERTEIPFEIVLYSILNLEFDTSISFNELVTASNSPALVFALSRNGLFEKIQEITEHYPKITFTETAGNRVLQFAEKPNPIDVLKNYYTRA